MKRYKNRIIISAVVLGVLAFAFWWGGNSPSLHTWTAQTRNAKIDTTETAVVADLEKNKTLDPKTELEHEKESSIKIEEKNQADLSKADEEYSQKNGMTINQNTGTDKYKTEPVPVGKPVPTEPADAKVTQTELKCRLSVRCDTILKNMTWFNEDKKHLVPSDGVIFAEKEVVFYDGESVFNVLLREMKKNKIHLEFMTTPVYNSAYIEGISNLYECDCGELSGWMYKVNGWFPNYGCSRYHLKDGDRIEWVYTCDLGRDVGGDNLIWQKDE